MLNSMLAQGIHGSPQEEWTLNPNPGTLNVRSFAAPDAAKCFSVCAQCQYVRRAVSSALWTACKIQGFRASGLDLRVWGSGAGWGGIVENTRPKCQYISIYIYIYMGGCQNYGPFWVP